MITQEPIMKRVQIHCNPSALHNIKELGLNWSYSQQFGEDEVDVVVIEEHDLDDEEFIESIGLDYQQVNCIELLDII